MARVRVGVFLGGASSEREISLASGRMIAEHLPRERYDVVLFDTLALMAGHPKLDPALREKAAALVARGAARARQSLTLGPSGAPSRTDAPPPPHPQRASPERQAGRDRELPAALQRQVEDAAAAAAPATEALVISADGRRPIDVAFIALHGAYGEDGTIQGLLEVLGIPYVGSGVLASALAMDKAMARKMFAADGLPIPRGVVVEQGAADEADARVRARMLAPAVVKPSRQGSSVGMSLADDPAAVDAAIDLAFTFDPRVVVEERVHGRELTVGVIGGRTLQALPPVEIVSKRAFFDYKAKYDPALCEEICPADLTAAELAAVQEVSLRAHRALDCRGLSRTDLILSPQHGPVVLEINTLPGMTINSLLPKAARAAGIPFGELLDRLVRLALDEE